uniref:hypothetical protein n=1 Tax=uncultured Erythrobacter sp. TaxID=263913 RepID=UPI0026157F68|nr:hypothetical protein [uncultured Erythrobacter sp.]
MSTAAWGFPILFGTATILDVWFGFGQTWRDGLLGLLLSICGMSLLIDIWRALRTGEIRSLGIDWKRHDYYFKLIVGIHLLLAGFSFWVGIYFLKALVPQ